MYLYTYLAGYGLFMQVALDSDVNTENTKIKSVSVQLYKTFVQIYDLGFLILCTAL